MASEDFRIHLRACMHHLDCKSCPADLEVWMQPKIKADGGKCWEHVLAHANDVLVISENRETVLREEMGKYFALKEKSMGPPRRIQIVTSKLEGGRSRSLHSKS